MASKACTRCGTVKPFDLFAKCASRSDGLQAWCKTCKAEHYQANRSRYRTRNWRKENPERARENDQRYYRENREKVLASNRRWLRENIEHKRERDRQCYAENRESRRAAKLQWYYDNREDVLAARRERYSQNLHESRAYVREQSRRYRDENPNRVQAIRKRYEARKRGADGSHSLTAWQRLVGRWGGRCAYCGERPEVLHEDHVVPLSRGGSDFEGNILPACPPCNQSKSDKFLIEWKRDGLRPGMSLTWQ